MSQLYQYGLISIIILELLLLITILMPKTKPEMNVGTDKSPRNMKPAWLGLVQEPVRSLRFGTVLITVHDYQIVKNEKLGLDGPSPQDVGDRYVTAIASV